MSRKRLELALRELTGANWERFEHFASEFLSAELPDLRTVASPSGDDGRDAELFSPNGDNVQVLQYSVTRTWKTKIQNTAQRIADTIPSAQLLIYVTNQLIGAEADELKRDIRRDFRLHLDIRDRNYFLERYQRSPQTEAAAEALATDIVEPFLRSHGVLNRPSAGLNTDEAKAAHVYLSLQFRDDVQEKGLTKLSFEALVRAVLIHTNSEIRMSRAAVKQTVRQILPNDDPSRVDQLTDSALSRLTKRAIRHWPPIDEFCLTYDESQRVAEYIAEQELDETALVEEIQATIIDSGALESSGTREVSEATVRVRRILEHCLYAHAESFAAAVFAANTATFATDHLPNIVLDDFRNNPLPKCVGAVTPDWLAAVIREILASPGAATQLYLRELADAYTLMAFLRQTPDVQRAVEKMFSHGEIWLDTSAILPLLAEELLEENRRQFQRMLQLAVQAGLKFFVTDGVIEELDSHISRSLLCSRKTYSWEGRLPFLLEAFVQTGRWVDEFSSWIEIFKGPNRPTDDIRDFLQESYQIQNRSLETESREAPEDFRQAVQETWHGIHERRREKLGRVIEPITVIRLSRHDAENYVGVVQQRTQEKSSPFGYSAWWLTLDRSAVAVRDIVIQKFGVPAFASPILSVDFLAQYLMFGPVRARLSKASLRTLPVVLEPRLVQYLTRELLEEASRIRADMKDLPEMVVRRRIRDRLDEARRRMGPLAARGVDVVLDEIRQ
jgi:hypothetical protein